MNLTLSVPDDVLERAREAARRRGTTVNALVRRYLERLGGRGGGEELAERFRDMWDERSGHSEGWRFDRGDLYEDRLYRGRSR